MRALHWPGLNTMVQPLDYDRPGESKRYRSEMPASDILASIGKRTSIATHGGVTLSAFCERVSGNSFVIATRPYVGSNPSFHGEVIQSANGSTIILNGRGSLTLRLYYGAWFTSFFIIFPLGIAAAIVGVATGGWAHPGHAVLFIFAWILGASIIYIGGRYIQSTTTGVSQEQMEQVERFLREAVPDLQEM
jgi:hypothetical protein